jgi:hypothetical protein
MSAPGISGFYPTLLTGRARKGKMPHATARFCRRKAMNLVTAVRACGKAAAAALLCAIGFAAPPAQAQVAFSFVDYYAHNNRAYQLAHGFFGTNNRNGLVMVHELYESGYGFSNFNDFHYISNAGAGYNGIRGQRGIAKADLDKDGYDESIVVQNGSFSINYHHQEANVGYFSDGSTMVAVADVDMDTWMDVITVREDGVITTYINNQVTNHAGPNGSFIGNLDSGYTTDFPEEWIIPGAQAIAAGLIDNNGRQGLAIANADGNVYIYLPYNGGGFDEFYWSLVETKSVGSNPVSIAIGDVDNDGTLDLVTANYGDSTISFLKGVGYGPFEDANNYDTGIAPTSVAIGKLNNDNVNDVVVGCSGENVINYFYGSGFSAAPLGLPQDYHTQGPVWAVGVGDLNQDNKNDIAFSAIDGYGVGVAFNNGSGSFGQNTFLSSAFQSSVPAIADFDGDGDMDVAALTSSDAVTIFRNDDGTLVNAGFYYFGGLSVGDAQALQAADVDNDGKIDLVGVGFWHGIRTLINLGDMQFADSVGSPVNNPNNEISPNRLALIDLNGDNYKDIIMIASGDDRVELRYNNTDGIFQSPLILTGAGDPWNIATGDIDGDGKADMVLTDRENNRLTIWKGVGASFNKIGTLAIGNKPNAVYLIDLNGDNKRDVVATTLSPVNDDADGNNDINEDRVSVAMGNGNGTFGAVTHYPTGRRPLWVQFHDMNYDGIKDAVVSCEWSGDMMLHQGNSDGTFRASRSLFYHYWPGLFSITDMNGDALVDLVIGSPGIARVNLYQNITELMTVTGTIQLQGRATLGGVQTTFEFRRSGSDEIFTRKATLNNAGNFTMTNVLAGDYTVNVKPAGGLSALVEGVFGGQGDTISLGTISFRNGDATGDNKIDISDLLLLIAHYNAVSPNANYLASVDFNNDGKNDITDLLLLIGNYNQSGAP